MKKSTAAQPKAPKSKMGSEPNAKNNFRKQLLPETENKNGVSPNGLSQAEEKK
jgi:hypothetical protein